jgi:hypothetical protein
MQGNMRVDPRDRARGRCAEIRHVGEGVGLRWPGAEGCRQHQYGP